MSTVHPPQQLVEDRVDSPAVSSDTELHQGDTQPVHPHQQTLQPRRPRQVPPPGPHADDEPAHAAAATMFRPEGVDPDPDAAVTPKRLSREDRRAERKKKRLPKEVAGYEILDELGRGGMGVVYKARQKGLNRIVALKMVLTGNHADLEQLARFHSEALAVAQLHHPHIVQIYEVGDQDGVPYFSLEYVEGGSLAQKIAGKPQTREFTARMTSELAHAVDHAHKSGIIHRDLKPGNVLLTRTDEPKITDFGLSKRLEGDSQFQTASGTLMGTPSYMAPEQALGDIHVIGKATDVYSLGTILYEMLTGRPPFLGTTLLDTLEQVRTQEPVAPSQLNPAAPRDLETICLKCLEKEPAKRYQDAGELADDVDRYQRGEAILARPVGNAERAWRWCKRNPRVAALTGGIAFLLVGMTIVSSYATVTINAKRIEAEAAKELAKQEETKAKQKTEIAIKAQQTLVKEVQDAIGDAPGLQDVKLKLLETALSGFREIESTAENRRKLQESMAGVYLKKGQLTQQSGDSETAYGFYLKCHEVISRIAEENPNDPSAMFNLAETNQIMGELSFELKRDVAASSEYYRRALELSQKVAGGKTPEKLKRPQVQASLSEAYTRVAVTHLRLGESAKALDLFYAALAVREKLFEQNPGFSWFGQNLSRTHQGLADVAFRLGDQETARRHYGQAIEINENIVEVDANDPRTVCDLGLARRNYAYFLMRTGRLSESAELYESAVSTFQSLATGDPRNALYQRYLATSCYRLASIRQRQGQADLAAKLNRQALTIREKLAAADPKNERRLLDLLLSLARCDRQEEAAAQADTLAQKPNLDREMLIELADTYSQCAATVKDPAAATYREKSLAALRQAVARGYKDRTCIETDPDLEPIRATAEFQAILNQMEQAK